MDSFISFLNTVTSADRIGFVCLCLAFAIVLEAFIPLFEFKGQKYKHVTRNLVFVLTTGVVTIVLAYLAFEVIRIEDYGYGVLNLVTLPVWVDAAVADCVGFFWSIFYSRLLAP